MMNKLGAWLLISYLGAITGCVVGSDEVADFEPPADESGGVDEAGNPPPADPEDPLVIYSLYPTTTLASNTLTNAALFKDGTNLYWATTDSLMRIPVTGGTPVKLVGSLKAPQGLAVDSTNIYWAEAGNSTDYHCYIKKMPKVGGPITRLYVGSYGCAGLAIDATTVYFTNYATGQVGHINKAGYGLHVDTVGGHPREIVVDTAGEYIWTNEGRGTIEGFTYAGDGDVDTLASNQAPTHLAISGSFVYWTNYDYGTVKRAPRDCATCSLSEGEDVVKTLASSQAGPRGIAVVGGWVYWTNMNSGAMMKAYASDGTSRTKITTVEVGAEKLLVQYRASRTPPSLYWTNPSYKKLMKIDQY